jgi:phosphoribosyl-ATP pyrophosphohydrolase
MAYAVKSSELKLSDRCEHASPRIAGSMDRAVPARRAPCPVCDCSGTPASNSGAVPARGEMDHLYGALPAVTAESHPRTARLLASGTRKLAQKVIEEAGEVALAAVKHNARGIVQESADLLYHLVAPWHRADIGPDQVCAEMRRRADELGIAEKLPKKLPKKFPKAKPCASGRDASPTQAEMSGSQS